jgi:ABC-2 type transport system permease protein
MGRIRELVEYREMTASLVRRELRGKYKGSILGFLDVYQPAVPDCHLYGCIFDDYAKRPGKF